MSKNLLTSDFFIVQHCWKWHWSNWEEKTEGTGETSAGTQDHCKLCGWPWVTSGILGLGGGDPDWQRPDGLRQECGCPAVSAEGAPGGRDNGKGGECRESQRASDKDWGATELFYRSD